MALVSYARSILAKADCRGTLQGERGCRSGGFQGIGVVLDEEGCGGGGSYRLKAGVEGVKSERYVETIHSEAPGDFQAAVWLAEE
jgi:hypothetical protein